LPQAGPTPSGHHKPHDSTTPHSTTSCYSLVATCKDLLTNDDERCAVA